MSQLERVLRELEIATVALAGADWEGRPEKLKKRSEAIGRLAQVKKAILELGPAGFLDVIRRLTRAESAGKSVQMDLARLKQELTAQWSRWSQVHRSLSAGGRQASNKVDYNG